jgi:ribose 1,5-bisphosphokinase PhnN
MRTTDLKVIELEMAKEILAEIFQVRAGEVEEMIQRRLEERSCPKARTSRPYRNMRHW